MRKIRKHITTIILAVLAVIAGVYAYNYHDMKQNIVYNEHLEDVAVTVNGKELTLRDMAFYVAYEEMNVEKQALVYDSDNPNKYWNIHTNGEFVRVTARKAAMSMAIHDEKRIVKWKEMTLAGVAAERNIRPVMRHLI